MDGGSEQIDWGYCRAVAEQLRRARRVNVTRALRAAGPSTARFGARVERLARRSEADQRAHAERALERLLAHASQRSPFYQERAGAARAPTLADFPVTSRHDLQASFPQMLARGEAAPLGALGQDAFFISRTSGSTGAPASHIKRLADEVAWDSALMLRLYREHGVPRVGAVFDCGLREPGEPLVRPRLVPGLHTMYNLRPFRLTERGVKEEYLAVLDTASPAVVQGAPTRVCELIDVVERFGAKPLRPKLVTVTYEELQRGPRRRMQEGLGRPPVALYGSAELGLCAWECPAGAYHFPPDANAIEVCGPDGPAAPGAIGSLIVTSLKSWAMPLIRYDTGDHVRRPSGPACPCGRSEPFVEALEGRREVRLLDSNGRGFVGYEPLSLLDESGLESFQIVQRRPGEVDVVVAGSAAGRQLERAVERLEAYFGPAMEVRLDPGGPFVLAPSGKRHAVVVLHRENAPAGSDDESIDTPFPVR